ncbi:hypothetical protein AALA44_03980 [Enterococcus ratti]
MENQHSTHKRPFEDGKKFLKVNLIGVFLGIKKYLNYFEKII